MLAALLLVLLAACAGEAVAPADTPAERTTMLVLWHAWPAPEQHILAALIDHYNQTHPETQVIAQAIPVAELLDEMRAASLAGSGPHLALLHSHTLGHLVADGLLLPLDEPLTNADELALLLPTALDSARLAGLDGTPGLYGLPLTFDTLALYHHRGAVPTAPANTRALLATADVLTNQDREPMHWGLAYTLSIEATLAYLPAFDGAILDEQGQSALAGSRRAGTIAWLEWLLALRQNTQILAVSDSIAVDSALNAQATLMAIDWAHALPEYRALWGDDLGVALLPRLHPGDRAPQPYVQSDVLSLNARLTNPPEQAAALDFARYLLSVEAQQALLAVGKQPVLRTVALAGDTPELAAARTFRAQAEQGRALPNTPLESTLVRDEVDRMLRNVLRELLSPAEAVSQTDAALRERLEAQP